MDGLAHPLNSATLQRCAGAGKINFSGDARERIAAVKGANFC
jgi:hypothetical protein